MTKKKHKLFLCRWRKVHKPFFFLGRRGNPVIRLLLLFQSFYVLSRVISYYLESLGPFTLQNNANTQIHGMNYYGKMDDDVNQAH